MGNRRYQTIHTVEMKGLSINDVVFNSVPSDFDSFFDLPKTKKQGLVMANDIVCSGDGKYSGKTIYQLPVVLKSWLLSMIPLVTKGTFINPNPSYVHKLKAMRLYLSLSRAECAEYVGYDMDTWIGFEDGYFPLPDDIFFKMRKLVSLFQDEVARLTKIALNTKPAGALTNIDINITENAKYFRWPRNYDDVIRFYDEHGFDSSFSIENLESLIENLEYLPLLPFIQRILSAVCLDNTVNVVFVDLDF